MQVDKRRAAFGDTITVTGKAERRSADSWVPIPVQSELWIGNGCDEIGCLFIFNNDIELAADGTFLARTAARRTGYFKATVTGIVEFFSATSAQTGVVKAKPAS